MIRDEIMFFLQAENIDLLTSLVNYSLEQHAEFRKEKPIILQKYKYYL